MNNFNEDIGKQIQQLNDSIIKYDRIDVCERSKHSAVLNALAHISSALILLQQEIMKKNHDSY